MPNLKIRKNNEAVRGILLHIGGQLLSQEQNYSLYDPISSQISRLVVRYAQQSWQRLNFKSVDDFDSVKRLLQLVERFKQFEELTFISWVNWQPFIPKRIHQRAVMEVALDAWEKKVNQLHTRQHFEAEEAAKEVLSRLRSLTEAYFIKKDINFAVYQQQALAAIEANQPVLETHRGFKQLLGNLLILIATLGTGFLINKACTGHFLFFKQTDSGRQLEKLRQLVDYAAKPLFITYRGIV